MPLVPIPFGGMQSLAADELVPIDRSLVAQDCYLDDGTIRPRNGYRPSTAASIGTSASVQGAWRFRWGLPFASATSVVVTNGEVLTADSPATELLTNGTVTSRGTPFGASANVSAAGLGSYLFLTDDSGSNMQRMDSTGALTSIKTIDKGVTPTIATSALSLVKLNTLTETVVGTSTMSTLLTDYRKCQPAAIGDGVTYAYAADQVWTNVGWLMLVISPSSQSGGAGTVSISIATNAGSFEKIGEIYDSPGDDSPNVVFCPLSAVTAATKLNARKIQFLASTNTNAFIVHAVMVIPVAPSPGDQKYRVTFQDSGTLQESKPTDDATINFSNSNIVFPSFHSVRGHNNGWSDYGANQSSSPDLQSSSVCFNKGAGVALPAVSDFAATPTINGNIPVGAQFAIANTVRLWRLTTTGYRLVTSVTYGGGVTTYSITDATGLDTLTHALYTSGGTAPITGFTCLASRAQRLIGASQNRIYISSFTPTGNPLTPFPQFPDISGDSSTGWSFDIAPSGAEQVMWLGNGDALYILTNESAYMMTSLEPNSTPYKIVNAGIISRRGAIWAENNLFFASEDGVYDLYNRVRWEETTKEVRRMYSTWLIPDSTTVVGYQSRKLYIFVGTRFMRLDFVTGQWTRGNVPHSMAHCVVFQDPGSRVQNMWFLATDRNLYRWQPDYAVGASNAATADRSTAIPPWIYQTGYEFTGKKTIIESFFMDATAPVELTAFKSGEDRDSQKKLTFQRYESQLPAWADESSYKWSIQLVGVGGAQCRRLLWDRREVDSEYI